MQNIVNKVRKSFQDFWKFLKLKFAGNRVAPQYILFEDFFRCENTARKLGYTFVKNQLSSPNKWIKLNSILIQIATVLLLIVELTSFALSAQHKFLYIMLENTLICGGVFITMVKIYVIFYRNKEKIREVTDKLDEHFPHSGVDQLVFKTQNYLSTLKRFESVYYVTFATCDFMFCSMPILHQIYGAMKSVKIEWDLVLALYLPFDQLQPVVYELMFSFESWIVIISTCYVLTTDLLYASLMQILAMEFDVLSQVMSEIDISEGEEEAIKELKNLVNVHQELIGVSEKLEEIFSPLLFINSFGVIAALCSASFLSVVSVNFSVDSLIY